MTEGWSYYIQFRDRRIPLQEGSVTVGRSRHCEISLDDPSISRKHLQLEIGRGEVLLVDLGSSNGTVVNGEQVVDSKALRSGDLVRMGDAEIRLFIEAPPFTEQLLVDQALPDSPLQTVRLPTLDEGGPRVPGDATSFLQRASVELAQQTLDEDKQGTSPEPLPESSFADLDFEEGAAAPAVQPPAPASDLPDLPPPSFTEPASAEVSPPFDPSPSFGDTPSFNDTPSFGDIPSFDPSPSEMTPLELDLPTPASDPGADASEWTLEDPDEPDPLLPSPLAGVAPPDASPRLPPPDEIAVGPPVSPPRMPAAAAPPADPLTEMQSPSVESPAVAPPTLPSLTDAMAEGPLGTGRGTRSQEILPSLDDLEASIGPQMPELPTPTSEASPTRSPTGTMPMTVHARRAGFWLRLLATFIDELWILALFLGASYAWNGPLDPYGQQLGALVASGISSIVILIGWSFWGTTPGKRLLGLYICTADGRPGIGVGRTLLRMVGYALSAVLLGIGFLLIAFHPEKKGLHDLIAGTRVFRA